MLRKNKIITILTICMVLISVFAINVNYSLNVMASGYIKITDNQVFAQVIEVIDGDSIKVKINGNGDIAYVRLAGIDAQGYDNTYEYLISHILGATVTLIQANTYSGGFNKWNYMYVYYNGKNLSEELLTKGLAVIDNSQFKTSEMLAAQDIAYGNGAEIWKYAGSNTSSITGVSGSTSYTSDKVNINTATKSQLTTYLTNVSSILANNIISYRQNNPFTTIEEIKFVEGMTKAIYDSNKAVLTVSTNINTANEYELKTLNNMSDTKIDQIINAREAKPFTYVGQLTSNGILSKDEYKVISNYISIKDPTAIDYTINSYISNVNGANLNYLTLAGLSDSNARRIISERVNGYTYKNLMELTKLPGIQLSEIDVHYLEDNLEVVTNLNSNTVAALNSIFGIANATIISERTFNKITDLKTVLTEDIYEQVKDYVYVNSYSNEYVNVNTATMDELKEQGMNHYQASEIVKARPIEAPSKLPFNIKEFNTNISLYTNINDTSLKELLSLNNGMNQGLATLILRYTSNQPFGSMDEVEQFFVDNNAYHVYSAIKQFIVIR